jgi:hypothetical protein
MMRRLCDPFRPLELPGILTQSEPFRLPELPGILATGSIITIVELINV